jgi:hypothetical protein
MLTFTPRLGAPDTEEAAGIAWLRETLDRLGPERGMPSGSAWQIAAGVRETGGPGPRLHQIGYQITAQDTAGRAYAVTCFVGVEDVVEADQRGAVEEVLEFWLDRLSTEPPRRATGGRPV